MVFQSELWPKHRSLGFKTYIKVCSIYGHIAVSSQVHHTLVQGLSFLHMQQTIAAADFPEQTQGIPLPMVVPQATNYITHKGTNNMFTAVRKQDISLAPF